MRRSLLALVWFFFSSFFFNFTNEFFLQTYYTTNERRLGRWTRISIWYVFLFLSSLIRYYKFFLQTNYTTNATGYERDMDSRRMTRTFGMLFWFSLSFFLRFFYTDGLQYTTSATGAQTTVHRLRTGHTTSSPTATIQGRRRQWPEMQLGPQVRIYIVKLFK